MKKLSSFLLVIVMLTSCVVQQELPLVDSVNQLFENVTHLEVKNVFCDVVIRGEERTNVDFKGEVFSFSDVKIKHELKGTSLIVWFEIPKTLRSSSRGSLTFVVPASCNLKISCVSGDLNVSDMESEGLALSTVSGNATVSGVKGEMSVQTVSGDVVLDSLSGILNVGSVSGDQSGSNIALTASSNFSTVSGDVNITFDNDISDISFSISSVSGDIVAKGVDGRKYLVLGSGYISVSASSVSGDVIFN